MLLETFTLSMIENKLATNRGNPDKYKPLPLSPISLEHIRKKEKYNDLIFLLLTHTEEETINKGSNKE